MGHLVFTETYDYKTAKKDIVVAMNEIADCEKDPYEGFGGGLPSSFQWYDMKCTNEDKARDFLDEKTNSGWYFCGAVSYYAPINFDKNKSNKLVDFGERKKAAYEVWLDKRDANHFENVKSEFIGCKKCGSRIARRYIRSNHCPACGTDMRPQSTLDSIARAHEKYLALESKYEEECEKQKSRCKKELKWLCRGEVHV